VFGELASLQRAMLPVLGALGGMVGPALVYASLHFGGPAISGWGIPMATDIAFAVAALSLLGSRVPPGLKVFLLALAIADDLGAIAVIAMFYTADLSFVWMMTAVTIFTLVYAMNIAGVRSIPVYGAVGAFAWYATLQSGVHATVAGVILGFLTPTVTDVHVRGVMDSAFDAIGHLRDIVEHNLSDVTTHQRQEILRRLNQSREVLSPLDFLTTRLEPWVGFFIMPLFALSNAGVVLTTRTLGSGEAVGVATAVALGLLIGKPIGITLFSFVAVKLRLAALPRGVNWTSIFATGLLAGIGFTVALFITRLAFDNPLFIDGSKVGILAASTAAGIVGLLVLSRTLPRH
jgi:NhaA family Na+:H+ antiporter